MADQLWRFNVTPVEGAGPVEIRLPLGAVPAGAPKAVYHSDRERNMYHYVYWWECVASVIERNGTSDDNS
jgi:hypothetical protein